MIILNLYQKPKKLRVLRSILAILDRDLWCCSDGICWNHHFSCLQVAVPSAPIITEFTLAFIFCNFSSSPFNPWYSFNFSYIFSSQCSYHLVLLCILPVLILISLLLRYLVDWLVVLYMYACICTYIYIYIFSTNFFYLLMGTLSYISPLLEFSLS